MRLSDSPIAAATKGRVVGVTSAANALAGRKLKRMKQKHEGKDLQGLVDLGREQGYLTFEQVNDYLPQDVASPTDLRAALDSFEDLDIKVLEEVPSESADEVEVEAKEEAEEAPEAPAPAADSLGESSDPVRLYLKEMGNFQLPSREQEVEIAKRIEAGENEVENEVLRSPVTLDFLIEVGDRIESGDTDLRESGLFEENEAQPDSEPDEEPGPQANEKQPKKLFSAAKKLKGLGKGPPPTKPEKVSAMHKGGLKVERGDRALSRHVHEAVIGEMRRLL